MEKGKVGKELMELWKQLSPSLKKDINQFLYVRLPSTLTIGGMDDLAVEVFDLIGAVWNKEIRKN